MILKKLEDVKAFYKKHKIAVLAVLLILLIAIPFIFPKSYTMGVFCRILMYATLAGSLNVINGYSGQMCIGHAGFFCIGTYCEAILSTRYGMSFWLLIPIAGIITAVIGVLIALPTLKMKGIYLSIVTLGFSEIVRLIALNWESVTGGPMGIKG
ncbi:MAG: branched-chain amino acid ABC transporter permease, partial [Hungatella sp.]